MTKHIFKLFIINLAVLSTGSAVHARPQSPLPTQSAITITAPKSDTSDQAGQTLKQASETYKASLQSLATIYENDLKTSTDHSAEVKKLLDEGLVSRNELEKANQSVTDAQAKLDDIHRQLATADKTLNSTLAGPALEAAYSASTSDQSWTTGKDQIDGLIRHYGEEYSVDPYLIYCVMQQESRFDSAALSGKGARGLMQLMPDTAARYGVVNASDPAQSIMGGAHYLKDLLQLFNGQVDLALAAYNAGEGTVKRYGNQLPPFRETQNYVKNISLHYLGISPVAGTFKSKTAVKRETKKPTRKR